MPRKFSNNEEETIIYRIGDVSRMIGLSKATIYREIKKGTFPKPVHLSARARGWRRRDLKDWDNSRTN